MEYKTEFGFINYDYIVNEKYPHGLLLFMGSYIYKEYRSQGKFKEMVEDLFSQMSKGTEVHLAISNKKLVPMFEKMGFEKTGDIEYWGSPGNTTNLKGKI
jgi:hypothetical protein